MGTESVDSVVVFPTVREGTRPLVGWSLCWQHSEAARAGFPEIHRFRGVLLANPISEAEHRRFLDQPAVPSVRPPRVREASAPPRPAHTYTHARAHTRTRARAPTYTRTRACACTYPPARACTHTYTRMRTNTHACAHTDRHTHSHTLTHARMHARTHARTHTHTHARPHGSFLGHSSIGRRTALQSSPTHCSYMESRQLVMSNNSFTTKLWDVIEHADYKGWLTDCLLPSVLQPSLLWLLGTQTAACAVGRRCLEETGFSRAPAWAVRLCAPPVRLSTPKQLVAAAAAAAQSIVFFPDILDLSARREHEPCSRAR